MKTIPEIMNSINGLDENGDAKAIIGIQYVLLNKAGELTKIIDKEDVYKPEINIFPRDGIMQVDIRFDSEQDISLAKIWKILEQYSNDAANYYANNDTDEPVPSLILNIIPLTEETDSYIIAGDPLMQALTAMAPKGSINCIRLIFDANFVHFFFSDDGIDMQDIETEVADELYRREYAERQANARREQRIAEIQKRENNKKK